MPPTPRQKQQQRQGDVQENIKAYPKKKADGDAVSARTTSMIITPPSLSKKKKKTTKSKTTTTTNSKIKHPVTRQECSDSDQAKESSDDDSGDSPPSASGGSRFVLDGVQYDSYQDMVQAKRERNKRKLYASGLVQATASLIQRKPPSRQSKRGNDPVVLMDTATTIEQRRVSKRIRGETPDGRYVDIEKGGRFTIQNNGGQVMLEQQSNVVEAETFYRGRVNSGDPLPISRAIQECDTKWIEEEKSFDQATKLFHEIQGLIVAIKDSTNPANQVRVSTPIITNNIMNPTTSTALLEQEPNQNSENDKSSLQAMIHALSVDDQNCVAKVCPDRIYSVAVHPAMESTIVCAGDKTGYVGIWKLSNGDANENDIHCLFRPHRGAISCLEWNASGRKLWSTSYDGTVRSMDVETQQFDQVFATYDDNEQYKSMLGFGLDSGHNCWTQFGCVDPQNEQCLYLSTSEGSAMHIDLRTPQQLTFNAQLSEKKINTLSVHPNGQLLVSAGLDCTVAIWDLRNLGSTNGKKSTLSPLASYDCGRSINSAFLSSRGESLLCTTMANTLEVFSSIANVTTDSFRPLQVLHHDNKTGRWLTTFQAIYHPHIEHLFAVGSMAKPRRLDIFDGHSGTVHHVAGMMLTAVVSRLAFHPRTDRIILAGGNSSGRVTIFR